MNACYICSWVVPVAVLRQPDVNVKRTHSQATWSLCFHAEGYSTAPGNRSKGHTGLSQAEVQVRAPQPGD
jgi:hypothetical protein